jgi:hypothetical protein
METSARWSAPCARPAQATSRPESALPNPTLDGLHGDPEQISNLTTGSCVFQILCNTPFGVDRQANRSLALVESRSTILGYRIMVAFYSDRLKPWLVAPSSGGSVRRK